MKYVRWNLLLTLILLTASCTEKKAEESQNDSAKKSQAAQPNAQKEIEKPSKILFVLTSHALKGDTGDSTGFYLSEAAHPWHILKDHYEIDFVSPQGGKAPVDGMKLEDPINKAFWENDSIQYKINHTLQPEEINPDDYVAIHYVGGHGAMWDFPDNSELAHIAADIYENGGVVSAVCHGPAGLLNIRLSNTQYLIKGKEVTGFTNEEEAAVALTNVVPFLLEKQLKNRKARFSEAEKFTPHVVVDQRVITGQNPQSAKGVGEAVLKELRLTKKTKRVSQRWWES